jgi:hypothetical protein
VVGAVTAVTARADRSSGFAAFISDSPFTTRALRTTVCRAANETAAPAAADDCWTVLTGAVAGLCSSKM